MYHCQHCGFLFAVFERRVCIGPCAPRRSEPCPECGTETINQHYIAWMQEETDEHFLSEGAWKELVGNG